MSGFKNNNKSLNETLNTACIIGDLELVIKCFNPIHNKTPDIYFDNDIAIKYACHYGHLDIVKYLLTSPDLKEHPDVNTLGDNHTFIHKYNTQNNSKSITGRSKNVNAFTHACKQGHLPIVQYLLNSPEIKKPAQFILNREGIKLLSEVAFMGKIKILDYLLNYCKNKHYPILEENTTNPIKKIRKLICQIQWKQKHLKILDTIFATASDEVRDWIKSQRELIQLQEQVHPVQIKKKAIL